MIDTSGTNDRTFRNGRIDLSRTHRRHIRNDSNTATHAIKPSRSIISICLTYLTTRITSLTHADISNFLFEKGRSSAKVSPNSLFQSQTALQRTDRKTRGEPTRNHTTHCKIMEHTRIQSNEQLHEGNRDSLKESGSEAFGRVGRKEDCSACPTHSPRRHRLPLD